MILIMLARFGVINKVRKTRPTYVYLITHRPGRDSAPAKSQLPDPRVPTPALPWTARAGPQRRLFPCKHLYADATDPDRWNQRKVPQTSASTSNGIADVGATIVFQS